MAYFKQETVKALGVKHTLRYMIDGEDGRFYINMPNSLTVHGIRSSYAADTFAELKQLVAEAIQAADEAAKTTKKIIRYRINFYGAELSDFGIETKDEREKVAHIITAGHYGHHSGYGFLMDFEVAYKKVYTDPHFENRSMADTIKYSKTEYFEKSYGTHNNHKWAEMDWDQDAEDFFTMIHEAQKNMMLKVFEFFKGDQQQILLNIKNNKLLN